MGQTTSHVVYVSGRKQTCNPLGHAEVNCDKLSQYKGTSPKGFISFKGNEATLSLIPHLATENRINTALYLFFAWHGSYIISIMLKHPETESYQEIRKINTCISRAFCSFFSSSMQVYLVYMKIFHHLCKLCLKYFCHHFSDKYID